MQNILLATAGFAPSFSERLLDNEFLKTAKEIIDLILRENESNPALALDRHWNLTAANRAVALLLKSVDPSQLQPPINVLRLTLHPQGLASQIINFAEWGAHLFAQLSRQIQLTADPVLLRLEQELQSYSAPRKMLKDQQPALAAPSRIATPFQ